MLSVPSLLFTLVLFSELSSHSVARAMPATAGNADDGAAEQDGLGSLLGDEPAAERAAVPPEYRRSLVLDGIKDDDGRPKIIIVSDLRPRGHGVHGLSPAFSRGLPVTAERGSSRPPAEYSLKIDRRDTDLDMLRCMIGRVYRPCWEV